MADIPRVTFGIIVLNGEPLTRYNLRTLYSLAHEIIVVEGASEKAADIATSDGHSIDGTLGVLRRFKAEEDPDGKLTIVTAEDHGYPNGFWPGEKDEQSQAYAERATGEYLWQVDIDEFYKPEDMTAILDMLRTDLGITQVNVPQLNFWGGFNYLVDGLFQRRFYRDLGRGVPRIFKWGGGYQYVKHRPPTVVDPDGVDARQGNWMQGGWLARKGIYCYHYATIFPDSVRRKIQYYNRQNWKKHDKLDAWYRSSFVEIRHPFHIHHVVEELSWLARYRGVHPELIQRLISDLQSGMFGVRLRETRDIELLLSKRRYLLGVFSLRVLAPLFLELQDRSPWRERKLERLFERVFSPSMPCSA